jgi:hypothetical protein
MFIVYLSFSSLRLLSLDLCEILFASQICIRDFLRTYFLLARLNVSVVVYQIIIICCLLVLSGVFF